MVEKIEYEISLKGDQAAAKGLDNVGKAGQEAFDGINKSAAGTGTAFARAGAAIKNLAGSFKSSGSAAAEAGEGLKKAAQGAAALASGSGGINGTTNAISGLAAAGGALGAVFVSLGAVAVLTAGLAGLAGAASSSASAFADLAGKTRISLEQLGGLEAAGVGSGIAFGKLGESLKAVMEMTKQTAANTVDNAVKFTKLSDALNETRRKGDELVLGFKKIKQEAGDAFKAFSDIQQKLATDTATASRDFDRSLRSIEERRTDLLNGPPSQQTQFLRNLRDLAEEEENLRDAAKKAAEDRLKALTEAEETYRRAQEKERLELKKLNQEIEDNDKKQRDQAAALARAQAEAEKNATALEKLGIAAVGANGKLKQVPEVMGDIANALKNTTDPAKRQQIEFDLIAAGIDRKLLPALRQGATAFKEFQETNKAITGGGFTTEQVKVADDYIIAVTKLGSAFSNLLDSIGLAVAPSIQPLVDGLREAIVNATPAITEFAKGFSEALGPALAAVGRFIRDIVIPAIGSLLGFVGGVADAIANFLGVSTSGFKAFLAVLATVALLFSGPTIAIAALTIAVGLLIKYLSSVDWSGFTGGASAAFGAVAGFARGAADIIVGAWRLVQDFFTALWTGITAAASLVWAGISTVAVSASTLIVETWTILKDFFALLWQGIQAAGSAIWQVIVEAATAASEKVKTLWNGFKDILAAGWEAIKVTAQAAWIFVSDQAKIAVDYITGIFTGLGAAISGIWEGIKNKILDVWNSVKDIIGKLLSGAAGGGGPIADSGGSDTQGFAGGGHVRGPGTGTSDSIPAWLSAGEFVLKAAAVKKYGLGLLHSLNNMRLAPGRFALGGLVNVPAVPARAPLRFAEGGLVPGGGGYGNTLNLTIGNEQFAGLRANDETMDRLQKFATVSRVRSAGRTPGWVGG